MPKRAPEIWCDMPPVAITRIRSSPGQASTARRIAPPRAYSRSEVGIGWRTMFTAMGVTGHGQGGSVT